MSRPKKSLNPKKRLGVYKRLEEVPGRYRLHHHADRYRGADTWQAFCDQHEYEQGSYDRYEEEVDRVGDHWKDHMDGRDRHHALATPDDVEAWATALLSDKSKRRSYDYWLRVRRFYDWLKWHTEHPHRYNPVLMATVVGDDARRIWRFKAQQNRDRREEYRSRGETDE